MAEYPGSPFQQLYARALSDDDFRRQLAEDPKAALTSLGIEPTDELLEAIEDAIEGVRDAQAILGDQAEFFIS